MLKQNTVSYLRNKDGNMVTFERWAYKKPETVISKLKELYSFSIYRNDIENGSYFEIWKDNGTETKLLKTVSSAMILEKEGK